MAYRTSSVRALSRLGAVQNSHTRGITTNGDPRGDDIQEQTGAQKVGEMVAGRSKHGLEER